MTAHLLQLEGHLAECQHCGTRYRSLAATDEAVRRKLTLLDEPAPVRESYTLTRRRSGRRLQFAAAAGLILAVALSAGPLRGWVVGLLRGPESEPATAVTETVGPEVTELRLSGTAVVVHFMALPSGSRLEVRRTDSDRLRFEDPTGEAAVTVGTNRIEIRPGAGAADGVFRLSVPREITSIHLQGPAGADKLLNPEGLPGVVDLVTFFGGRGGP